MLLFIYANTLVRLYRCLSVDVLSAPNPMLLLFIPNYFQTNPNHSRLPSLYHTEYQFPANDIYL